MADKSDEEQDEQKPKEKMESVPMYTLDDNLPASLSLLFGFQQFLMVFVCVPLTLLMLVEPMCMTEDKTAISELICANFVVAGITTLLQNAFGVRLPIMQGPSLAYLAPTFSILSLPQWTCPNKVTSQFNSSLHKISTFQTTLDEMIQSNMSSPTETGSIEDKVWLTRIREVNGAIMVASLLQVFLGFSGLLGLLLRYLGPLSIAPTIALVGLGLADAAVTKSAHQWWIALLTLALIVVFSECMDKVSIPIPCFTRQSPTLSRTPGSNRCHRFTYRLHVFAHFSVLLGVLIIWFICYLLTVTDVFPRDANRWGHSARTDVNADALTNAAWFYIPYPGRVGLPTVSVGAVLGMMAGVLASILESIGDYHACVQLAHAPPLPVHAINRGIGMEGIGCVIGGLMGTANGLTSYSHNIAAIGITKVASRQVMFVAAILLLLVGCVGKVGAFFITISEPIVGGLFLAMFGVITAVGLSHLQYVNLSSPRNMMVIGLSLLLGLSVPRWMANNASSIDTGSDVANQILRVLLSTGMFVGGLTGFFLDNLLPGTAEDRGMTHWRQELSSTEKQESGNNSKVQNDVYSNLPLFRLLSQRFSVLGRLPFCPTVRVPVPTEQELEQITNSRE